MREAACVRACLPVQMCMFVQMCVNKWLKVTFNKINSWASVVYTTARTLTRNKLTHLFNLNGYVVTPVFQKPYFYS